MNQSEIHAGHRDRMIEKFIAYPDSLNDHEILEILLYNLMPRKDTNPLAHKILRVFGDLNSVINATEKELMTVEGVGKKIASGLMVIGSVYKRILKDKDKKQERWSTLELIVSNLRKIIKDYTTEHFVMVLLNSKCIKISHLEFEDRSKNSVTMDAPEVYSAFAVHKPRYVIVAHTHPSGVADPSLQDDFTTYKLNILCDIHGVSLLEHIILTEKSCFSYRSSGRMETVRKIGDLEKLIKQIKEKENE